MQYGEGRVPEFGPTVLRSKLLGAICRAGEKVVVLAGPAGYGKSVLAAQLATSDGVQSIWVNCSALDCNIEQLISALRISMLGQGIYSESGNRSFLMPGPAVSDLLAELVDILEGIGRPVVVVLDDVTVGADLTGISRLAEIMQIACSKSRLVVTTRWESVEVLDALPRSFALTAESLRLSETECEAILNLYSEGNADPALVRQIFQAAAGRVATVCVLARRAALNYDGGALGGPVSLDLRSHLNALASTQLDDRARRCLHACALLRTGSIVEVEHALGRSAAGDLELLGRLMPLMNVDSSEGLPRFNLHDIAAEVYEDNCFANSDSGYSEQILDGVLDALDRAGRCEALLALALRRATLDVLEKWAMLRGRRVLESGGSRLLSMVLSRLGSCRVVQHSRLLLLSAELLRDDMEYDDAMHQAYAARDLALHENDERTAAQALMMVARLKMDQGSMYDAAIALDEILDCGNLEDDNRTLAHAYLAICRAFTADVAAARIHLAEAERRADSLNLSPEVEVRVRNSMLAVKALLFGRWDSALEQLFRLREIQGVPFSLRMQTEGNIGATYVELGRLQRAESLLDLTIRTCEQRSIKIFCLGHFVGVAAAQAGRGEYCEAEHSVLRAIEGCSDLGYMVEVARGLVRRAVWVRALGSPADAATFAETAFEYCSNISCIWLTWSATLESAASLLALGDTVAASQQASSVRESAIAVDAALHVLIADLILAEIDRRNGDIGCALERLGPHVDYVLTESANWWIGMYVRAFPHLLGLVASVVGPNRLPAHLLRMVLPQDADSVLLAAREVMGDDDWRKLALRIGGMEVVERLGHGPRAPVCKVQMFGGLEVTVGARVVRERDWQKRKARLLFAMLVLKQGQDVPRDLIFEHLWPDKDFEKARNNLYVIWSVMKAALMGKAVRDLPLPYVENLGGVCRAVMSLIELDIAEFDRQLTAAGDAERNGDVSAALRAYERLDKIYQGELLPGDVYDDWFATERSRYRIAFGDAMLKAAGHLERAGDLNGALRFARSGLVADAWREDLYQCVMRNLAATGQRSAAIEVYMTCRRRLAEDLGLDPSSETLRLYEQILAMEGSDTPDVPPA